MPNSGGKKVRQITTLSTRTANLTSFIQVILEQVKKLLRPGAMDLASCAVGKKELPHLQVRKPQPIDDATQSYMKPEKSSELVSGRSTIPEHSTVTNGDCSVQVSKTGSRIASQVAEPEVGAEAPQPPLDDGADLEDTADNVEFPEVVVLVGKTQWCCVTCMVHFPRTTSIDSHMNDHHKQQQQDISPTALTPAIVLKRGHRRGRGKAASSEGRSSTMTLKNPPPEVGQKPSKLSHRPVQKAEGGKSGGRREVPRNAIQKLHRGRGRGLRGSRYGRGRGQGGRGRRKLSTKPLTSDDSDTEADAPAQKRKTSVGSDADEVSEDAPSVTFSKKARLDDEENANLHSVHSNEILPDIPASSESVSRDTGKYLIKEKYVVVMEKAGTTDCPSEPEGNLDMDPPLPIETPSLQADTFLPPATPIVPDLHGPPGIPIPLDSENGLQMHETPHQPDTSYHTTETPHAVDPEECVPPRRFLSHGTPGILSVLAQESSTKGEDRVYTEDQSVGQGGDFGSSGILGMDTSVNIVCITCGMAFNSPDELESHRIEMMKYDVVSCHDCGDKFHGLHQLNMHIFTAHEKLSKRFCFFCKADFLNDFELEEHLLRHTANETGQDSNTTRLDFVKHTCKTCRTEMVGNISVLIKHYHTAHNQYICMECLEIFTDATVYEAHKDLHTSDVDDASEVYDNDEVLHEASGASDPIIYACPVRDCFKICRDKEALMDHISWHEDQDLEDEQLNFLHCHHCDGQFYHKVALDRHLSEIHNEPDLLPFVCELCNEAFSHSVGLHHHNNHYHCGVKRYGCAYCDECFESAFSHRQHVVSEHDVAATVLCM